MKSNASGITVSRNPVDFKEVFKHYLLKKAVIEKYNSEDGGKFKNKTNE